MIRHLPILLLALCMTQPRNGCRTILVQQFRPQPMPYASRSHVKSRAYWPFVFTASSTIIIRLIANFVLPLNQARLQRRRTVRRRADGYKAFLMTGRRSESHSVLGLQAARSRHLVAQNSRLA